VHSTIIVGFVDKRKYFSIEYLNNKIVTLDFGPDNRNRPVSLEMTHVRKNNLKLSGIECQNLFLYFSIMIADKIPQDDDLWDLYFSTKREGHFMLGVYQRK